MRVTALIADEDLFLPSPCGMNVLQVHESVSVQYFKLSVMCMGMN